MTVIANWDLFEDMRSAQDELMRMSRVPAHWVGQFRQQPDPASGAQAWVPAVDIIERGDAYLVTAELPGVGVEALEITFEDSVLTIQGERHHADDAAGDKLHRSERRYGQFRRSITLPSHVQADKIEASAQDGVLQVLVPKAKETHARHIHVRAGKAGPAITGTAVKNGA